MYYIFYLLLQVATNKKQKTQTKDGINIVKIIDFEWCFHKLKIQFKRH